MECGGRWWWIPLWWLRAAAAGGEGVGCPAYARLVGDADGIPLCCQPGRAGNVVVHEKNMAVQDNGHGVAGGQVGVACLGDVVPLGVENVVVGNQTADNGGMKTAVSDRLCVPPQSGQHNARNGRIGQPPVILVRAGNGRMGSKYKAVGRDGQLAERFAIQGDAVAVDTQIKGHSRIITGDKIITQIAHAKGGQVQIWQRQAAGFDEVIQVAGRQYAPPVQGAGSPVVGQAIIRIGKIG